MIASRFQNLHSRSIAIVNTIGNFHGEGGTALFRFSGSSLTWITRKGPDQGRAGVSIDRISKGTFDLYSASVQEQAFETFSGLSSAEHKIVIKVKGEKDAASTYVVGLARRRRRLCRSQV